MTQLVTSGQLIKTLARSCRGHLDNLGHSWRWPFLHEPFGDLLGYYMNIDRYMVISYDNDMIMIFIDNHYD